MSGCIGDSDRRRTRIEIVKLHCIMINSADAVCKLRQPL